MNPKEVVENGLEPHMVSTKFCEAKKSRRSCTFGAVLQSRPEIIEPTTDGEIHDGSFELEKAFGIRRPRREWCLADDPMLARDQEVNARVKAVEIDWSLSSDWNLSSE